MLSFAGRPFVPLTPRLRVVIERWWEEEAPDLWSFPAYSLDDIHHLPVPDRPPRMKARLNVLYWPSGASRWPVFHGLASDTDADAMGAAAESGAQPLLIKDEKSRRQISPQMHLLVVRPVFVRGKESARLRWVTLVGPSFYWWVKNPVYTFANGDSWNALLTNVVTAASGIAPVVPSVPVAYANPSYDRWGGRTIPLPLVIDAAAVTVGFRFVGNLDGTCGYATADNSASADLNRWEIYNGDLVLGGRASVDDVIGVVPERVAVGFGDPPVVTTVSLASLSLPAYAGASAGVSGADGWVFGELPPVASGSDRINYATRAATDYYGWALSLTDASFRGVLPLTGPTGLEDRIEWEYMPGRRSFSPTPPRNPIDVSAPPERLVTRVVPVNWADRNQYGGGWYVAWAKVTGGSESAGYSGKKVILLAGNVWGDEAPGVTYSSCIWRAPSNETEASGRLPVISADQVVRIVASRSYKPGQYETDAVGAQTAVSLMDSNCVGQTVLGRDLIIAPATPPPVTRISAIAVGTPGSGPVQAPFTLTIVTRDIRGGTPPYTVTAYDGLGGSTVGTTVTLTYLEPGSYRPYVIVTDSGTDSSGVLPVSGGDGMDIYLVYGFTRTTEGGTYRVTESGTYRAGE